jgi:phage terminase small subunit
MEKMTKPEIIKILVESGNDLAKSTIYADCFLEYQEATENIDKNGLIVQHPRTMNPIENPYMKIRDGAIKKIANLPRVKGADFLWKQ